MRGGGEGQRVLEPMTKDKQAGVGERQAWSREDGFIRKRQWVMRFKFTICGATATEDASVQIGENETDRRLAVNLDQPPGGIDSAVFPDRQMTMTMH